MSRLDNQDIYEQRDPSRMRERLRGLGRQCRDASQQVGGLKLPDAYSKVCALVLAGVGGSGIGGDLLADLGAAEGARLPIFTWRDYGLPQWVDRDTLVIVSSYSGETEETLSAFHTAVERGAQIVVMTSGGTLQKLAEAQDIPVIHVPYEGEARLALGYALVAPVALLAALGLLPEMEGEVQDTAALIDGMAMLCSEDRPQSENIAKALASQACGRLPVIYGGDLLAGAARRWKNDINENAKSWAVAETFPELGHNSITAFGFPDCIRNNVTVFFLRPSLLLPRTNLRYQVAVELLDQHRVPHVSWMPLGLDHSAIS